MRALNPAGIMMFVILGLLLDAALWCVFSCAPVNSAEVQSGASHITSVESAIQRCEAVGNDTGSYRVYRACMVEGGLLE